MRFHTPDHRTPAELDAAEAFKARLEADANAQVAASDGAGAFVRKIEELKLRKLTELRMQAFHKANPNFQQNCGSAWR